MSLTVNVATPEPLVTPETVVIVEEPPPLASVTVLPATGFDCASLSVTVIVEVVAPSAVTERRGGADRRLRGGHGVPAVKVTVAVCVTVTESVVSVAV